MKNTLTFLITALLCTSFPTLSNAQGWKGAAKKAVSNAEQKVAKTLPTLKIATQNAGKKVQHAQISEALLRANRLWRVRNFQNNRDKNALSHWALAQSLRKTSPIYQSAVKDVSFVRAHAAKAAPSVKRDVVHVNSVAYNRLTRKANRIFIAADINDGTRWQLSKLIQSVRKNNPGKKLVVASPYFPESNQLFTAGSYARFQQENGADILVQTI